MKQFLNFLQSKSSHFDAKRERRRADSRAEVLTDKQTDGWRERQTDRWTERQTEYKLGLFVCLTKIYQAMLGTMW
jgi:hypothetical protein